MRPFFILFYGIGVFGSFVFDAGLSDPELAKIAVEALNDATALVADIEAKIFKQALEIGREVFQKFYDDNISPQIRSVQEKIEELPEIEAELAKYEVCKF